jgi:copper chaperone CopZ
MCEAHAALAAAEHGASAPADIAGGRLYTVKGMTCDHCVASVTEEVEQVAGVTSIAVDLPGGRVAVIGEGFSDAAIREAVDEAGYELVGP